MDARKSDKDLKRRWGPRGTAAATIAGHMTFEHVSRLFSEQPAVFDFSLEIAPAEIVCLLGPSGCGKTTLLRLAAGIERPTQGRILLNGQEVSGPNRFVPPEKRSVGLMFQDFALFPHLTLLENVAFGLKDLNKADALKEARSALERVGLAHYASDYPHILSGGEQQRVALARAIAPRPSVLLMDEPFSGLDPRLRDFMREETLAILHETRATCMIVTHQPEEAMRMGDRIVIMKSGRLVQQGDARTLYSQPASLFVARMFSEINELTYTVANGLVQTPLGGFDAKNFSEQQSVLVCIRQNDVCLGTPREGRIGRVLRSKFLGDAALLEVAVDGLETPLLAKLRENDAPRTGAEVGVFVNPERVLLFEAEKDTKSNG